MKTENLQNLNKNNPSNKTSLIALAADPQRYFLNEFLLQVKGLRQKYDLPQQKCFISYAWEAEKDALNELQQFLIQLREDLQTIGFDVFIDIKNMYGDLNERMHSGIEESNFIILIGTPTLQKRVQIDNSNVRFEWNNIEKKIAANPDALIPILFKGDFNDAFPPGVTKKMVYDLNHSSKYCAQLAGIDNPIGILPAILFGKNQDSESAHQYREHYQQFVAQLEKTPSALAIIQNIYQETKTVQGMFGQDFPLREDFINVQKLDNTLNDKITDQQKKSEDARISSYEDLLGAKEPVSITNLFSANNNPAGNFLLIQGRAGVGKSSFVTYVAHQWSLNHRVPEHQQLWAQFEWLFVMRMRDLSNDIYQGKTLSLQEWIYLSYFANNTNNNAQQEFNQYVWPSLERAISNHQLLMILDGYDETPASDPSKQAVHSLLKSHIPCIITSRSYGVSELQSYAHQDLELMGFIDKNISTYISLYFGEAQSKHADTLTKALQKNKLLWGSAHIPVTLNLICGLIESKISNDDHVAEFFSDVSCLSNLYEEMERKLIERAFAREYPQQWAELLNDKKTLQMTDADYQQKLRNTLEKHYQTYRQVLSYIAFKAFHANKLLIELPIIQEALTSVNIVNSHEQSQFIYNLLKIGLFRKVADTNGYEFLHLTFQEYYAAHYSPIVEILKEIKLDPRYEIVLWFIAGHLKSNPEKLKTFIYALQKEAIDVVGDYDLALLIRCSEEAYTELKALNALRPIKIRVRAAIRHLFRCWIQGTVSKDSIPPMWLKLLRLSVYWLEDNEEALVPMDLAKNQLAEQNLAEFLAWLQLPRDEVYKKLMLLMENKKAEVLCAAVTALSYQTLTAEILSLQVKLLWHSNVRVSEAANAVIAKLAETQPATVVDTLISAFIEFDIENLPFSGKDNIIQILIKQGPRTLDAFVKTLSEALTHQDAKIRKNSVNFIGQILCEHKEQNNFVIEALKNTLHDTDPSVRIKVIDVFKKIDIWILIQELFNPDLNIVRTVVKEFPVYEWHRSEPETPTSQMIDNIICLLDHELVDVRVISANILNKLFKKNPETKIANAIIQTYKLQNDKIRFEVLTGILFCHRHNYTEISMPVFIDTLINALLSNPYIFNSSISDIYDSMIIDISSFLGDKILNLFIEQYEKNIPKVQKTVFQYLKLIFIKNNFIIEKKLAQLLIKALDNKDLGEDAAKAIAEIGEKNATTEIFDACLKILNDDKVSDSLKGEICCTLIKLFNTDEHAVIIAKSILKFCTMVKYREIFKMLAKTNANNNPIILAYINLLFESIHSTDNVIRYNAVKWLLELAKFEDITLDSKIISELLVSKLDDPFWDVRQMIARDISELEVRYITNEIIQKLIGMLYRDIAEDPSYQRAEPGYEIFNTLAKLCYNNCELVLMSEKIDKHPSYAEGDKVYLKLNGEYISKFKGKVFRASLIEGEFCNPEIDITNLEQKLSVQDFKNAVLDITSKRSHTSYKFSQIISDEATVIRICFHSFKDNTGIYSKSKIFSEFIKKRGSFDLSLILKITSEMETMNAKQCGYTLACIFDSLSKEVSTFTSLPAKMIDLWIKAFHVSELYIRENIAYIFGQLNESVFDNQQCEQIFNLFLIEIGNNEDREALLNRELRNYSFIFINKHGKRLLTPFLVSKLLGYFETSNHEARRMVANVLSNCRQLLLENSFRDYFENSKTFEEIVMVLIIAYFSKETVIHLSWNETTKNYTLNGFVDREQFCFKLKPEQAQWYIYRVNGLMINLRAFQFDDLFQDLDPDIAWPAVELDPLLMNLHVGKSRVVHEIIDKTQALAQNVIPQEIADLSSSSNSAVSIMIRASVPPKDLKSQTPDPKQPDEKLAFTGLVI